MPAIKPAVAKQVIAIFVVDMSFNPGYGYLDHTIESKPTTNISLQQMIHVATYHPLWEKQYSSHAQ